MIKSSPTKVRHIIWIGSIRHIIRIGESTRHVIKIGESIHRIRVASEQLTDAVNIDQPKPYAPEQEQKNKARTFALRLDDRTVTELGFELFKTEFVIDTGLGLQPFTVGQFRERVEPFTELARPMVEIKSGKIVATFWNSEPVPNNSIDVFIHVSGKY